ncbi:hypothetical protein GUJ93_ZPchr0002g23914 [Zizania palustris]|uniref:Secreted protein n=1 Tax=Zizania palustris TaxID=103762 RepID=A0A8J5VSH2_ZIZPA|nr:hypothetical protein GUJ93_ZPchr0002g23914 [Zizania palustris]
MTVAAAVMVAVPATFVEAAVVPGWGGGRGGRFSVALELEAEVGEHARGRRGGRARGTWSCRRRATLRS